MFWLLIAEIFPLALRGRAMSLATVANWVFNLIVSATFLDLVAAVGSAGAFLVYAVLSLAALAFIVADGAGDEGAQPRADRGGAGAPDMQRPVDEGALSAMAMARWPYRPRAGARLRSRRRR